MKNPPLVNWLAVLGIGGAFAFQSEVSAQEPPPTEKPRPETGDVDDFYVVINHEEQYSVWPGRLELPRDWTPVLRGAPTRTLLEQMEGPMEQVVERSEGLRFTVVINHEEQYSIWPAEYEVPEGFRLTDEECGLRECMELLTERRRR